MVCVVFLCRQVCTFKNADEIYNSTFLSQTNHKDLSLSLSIVLTSKFK